MTAPGKVLPWRYRPVLAGTPATMLSHAGGSSVAWIQIVTEQDTVLSVDSELVATSRLLIEQRESKAS